MSKAQSLVLSQLSQYILYLTDNKIAVIIWASSKKENETTFLALKYIFFFRQSIYIISRDDKNKILESLKWEKNRNLNVKTSLSGCWLKLL